MKHAATITFVDSETEDEACVVVRYDETTIGLCSSLKTNGDIEVYMTKDDARKLIEALKEATK